MRRFGWRAGLCVVVAALCSFCSCGGSGSPESKQRMGSVPAVCPDTFITDTTGTVASAGLHLADEPTPVALSSCRLDADRNVQIGGPGGCGPDVVVDQDFTGDKRLGKITINSDGKLVFPDLADPDLGTPQTLDIETAGIRINSGGLFSAGVATCPVGFHPGAHVTITFTGRRDPSCKPETGCDDGSVKGIEVRSGGILRLYGAKGVPNPDPAAGPAGISWTALSATALPQEGGATLHLADDVTKGQRPWEKDDWIVVGTSSFSPYESEFVQITEPPAPDGNGGSVVKTQSLQYTHFGSDVPTASQECSVDGKTKTVVCGSVAGCIAPCNFGPNSLSFHDPASKNFGIDERAEVGLISRSIKLTATTPAPPQPDVEPLDPSPGLHWGGEIRIAGNDNGPPRVSIVGVELEKMGKDQLGSYPIHFHMVGDAKNAPTINANSIHHSFNKCITVHMSSNLTFNDNVCARIVGHIFYEEYGSEEHIRFQHNLGLGAMSNSFDLYKVKTLPPNEQELKRSDLIDTYWWKGDHLARSTGYNYDGFNIPNTDNQQNPTRGSCQLADGIGGFGRSLPPFSPPHPDACKPGEFYTEPASGFWITNPTTELVDNAIGGCQGVGRGVWWVPPANPIDVNGQQKDLKFQPLGTFANNRAHACYAGFYGEQEYGVQSTVLVPHKDGTNTGQPIIADLDGMTATRNRFRGVWLRPTWFTVENGRFATSRENVSLVTSGGIDGNAPGVWALLQNSVVAGVSENNTDRFGPCPTDNQLGVQTGGQFGCIDHLPPAYKVCAPGSDADKVGKQCTAPADCCHKVADCPDACTPPSADEVGLGYPPPSWNMFGYMLYDGPVRVFDDRFVNFKADVSSLLTVADNTFLKKYAMGRGITTAQLCIGGPKKGQGCNLNSDCPESSCRLSPFVYEGDAALGWFQSNQSSYPTGTVTRGLSWDNTDLRHQIYTDLISVNLAFNDGDKNTAVIDEDGTLTGYGVSASLQCSNDPSMTCTAGDPSVCPPGGRCDPILPISLNNLPFNATSNSVDECFSRGEQNSTVEGRDTSLISAGSMGTLEFSTLYPWKDATPDNSSCTGNGIPDPCCTGSGTGTCTRPVPFPGPDGDVTHTQFVTFTRDDLSVGSNNSMFHPNMTLHSRDGRGIWEPKVTSGFGYTAVASPAPNFPQSTGKAGIASIIDVGVADIVKPDVGPSNPFFIRLGICYTKADGVSHPQDPSRFSITRGYKSYTGGFVDPNDPELLKYWSPSACNNLDSLNTANITGPACPGPRERIIPLPPSNTCPSGSTPSADRKSCVFPTDQLDLVEDPAQMLNADGTPNLESFSYDKDTGMLFLWVAQDEPNPVAPSPLGSCTGNSGTDDPTCPDIAHGETYYACPAKGCHVYLIKLDDPSYSPGASNCQPYEKYTHAPFTTPNTLVLYGTTTAVQQTLAFDKAGDPFHTPTQATDPMCQTTAMSPSAMPTDSALSAGSLSGQAPTALSAVPSVADGIVAQGQSSAGTGTQQTAADSLPPNLASAPMPVDPTPTPTPIARPISR